MFELQADEKLFVEFYGFGSVIIRPRNSSRYDKSTSIPDDSLSSNVCVLEGWGGEEVEDKVTALNNTPCFRIE